MCMELASDSSTLILLSKITITKHVWDYLGFILIPECVFIEVIEKGKKNSKDDAIIVENLIKEDKIKIKKIKNNKLMKELMLNFKVNRGEAEALILAMENNLPLLVDDKEAIKVCRIYDIKFITAISLLVEFVKEDIINKESALIKIENLKKISYYSEDIIKNAMEELKWKQ